MVRRVDALARLRGIIAERWMTVVFIVLAVTFVIVLFTEQSRAPISGR